MRTWGERRTTCYLLTMWHCCEQVIVTVVGWAVSVGNISSLFVYYFSRWVCNAYSAQHFDMKLVNKYGYFVVRSASIEYSSKFVCFGSMFIFNSFNTRALLTRATTTKFVVDTILHLFHRYPLNGWFLEIILFTIPDQADWNYDKCVHFNDLQMHGLFIQIVILIHWSFST